MHTMIEDADLPRVVMPSCEVRKVLAGQKALVTGASIFVDGMTLYPRFETGG
jgi:hypothetical protein